MSMHVSSQRLQQLRSGQLAPQEIVETTRHLAACAECAAMARREVDIHRAAASLTDTLLSEDDERRADLRSAVAGRPVRRPLWLAAAAAAVVIAVILALPLLRPQRVPRPETPPHLPAPPLNSYSPVDPSYGRADWDAAVREALAHGIAAPASLRPPPDALRNDNEATPHVELSPSRVVVESQQPRFTWSKIGRACRVAVYSGDRRVARSSRLTGSEWMPPAPLPRGRTYTWQLEAEGKGPRILDEAAVRDLDDARRLHPADPLLLGVLEARAGLKDEALRDLARHLAAHPHDAAARRLTASLRRW